MRFFVLLSLLFHPLVTFAAKQPNVILVMADDMGYGQTGYYNHPVLQTPNLDAMRPMVYVLIDFMLVPLIVHQREQLYLQVGLTIAQVFTIMVMQSINRKKLSPRRSKKLVIQRLISASGI